MAAYNLRVSPELRALYPYRRPTARDCQSPDALFLGSVVPEIAIWHAPPGAPYDKGELYASWLAAVQLLSHGSLPVDSQKRSEARKTLIQITKAVNDWIEDCRQVLMDLSPTERDVEILGGGRYRLVDSGVSQKPEKGHYNADRLVSVSLYSVFRPSSKAIPVIMRRVGSKLRSRAQYHQVSDLEPADARVQGGRCDEDSSLMLTETLLRKPNEARGSESWQDTIGVAETRRRRCGKGTVAGSGSTAHDQPATQSLKEPEPQRKDSTTDKVAQNQAD